MSLQRTLKSSFSIHGVGLHTGKSATINVKPAPENNWFTFKRVDIDGTPCIPADVAFVTSTIRGTTLEKDGVKVHTCEHILAAFVGMGLDNVIVDLDGPEIPIMNGSSKTFVDKIKEVGIIEQNLPKNFFVIKENLTFEDAETGSEFLAVPQEEFRITVMVDYNSPQLGTQHAQMYTLKEFEKEIAEARTFVFLKEVEDLAKKGLIKGGSLDNAIVMVDKIIPEKKLNEISSLLGIEKKFKVEKTGVLNNTKLRYENEPARHKLLDIIGDLALIGRPIKGHILGAKPGHKSNIAFAKQIKKFIKQDEDKGPIIPPDAPTVYDVNDISKLLPHRFPFLLVDKIIELNSSFIIGYKNVTMNETHFLGHFPENPVMPGVLQIEAMAQVGGILGAKQVDNPKLYTSYLSKIDKVKFKRKVIPGDQLVFKLSLISPFRRGILHAAGKGYVNGKLAIEAELMAQLVKNNKS